MQGRRMKFNMNEKETEKTTFLKKMAEEFDDRSQDILALLIIAVTAMFVSQNPESVITGCIGGIAGLAMGKNRQ